MNDLEKILQLVDSGILGSELCPEEHYWHWPVKNPDELPEEFKGQYAEFEEIRWYGN